MAGPEDRRRDSRLPLLLRVGYPAAPGGISDATENLSAGGLFVRTDRDLRQGDRLPLQIDFPGLLAPLQVEVEVVRLRAQGPQGSAGVAVKVPDDRPADRQRLASLAASAREGAALPQHPWRVLVVEDNPHAVRMYDYALRKRRNERGEDLVDAEVEFAPDGHAALERLGRPPPVDLVMSDLYMPVMDGFALVERMRADPALAAIPIVVISAGGTDARDRALALGVDIYLQKPVQFSDVISTVRTLLRTKR